MTHSGPDSQRSDRALRRAAPTPEDEPALVAAAEGGDPEARRRLVEAFLPAIAGTARRYRGALGVEREELLQEGVAGLLFAARRYDERLGTPFWAYASFWVRKAMQELVAELSRPVALSDRAVRGLAQIRAARRDHVQVHGAEPTSAQLIAATGFTRAQLESLQASDRAPRGFDEPLQLDGEAASTLGELVADPGAEDAYHAVLDRIEIGDVTDLTDRLDARERAVIRAHYGLGRSAQTLSQIGASLGLTAERARQIEVDALKKLRAELSRPATAADKPI